jgi:hypothetical protein
MTTRGAPLSFTNNTGSPDSPRPDKNDLTALEAEGRQIPLKFIVLAAGVLIFACMVGVQVIGVLYLIVFPPAPPLPEGVVEVSHMSSDYGVDEWLYTTSEPACRVVQFYINEGTQCRFVPDCDAPVVPEISANAGNATQSVTRCVGERQVSIFAMRWQVVISVNSNLRTEFRLQREVYWTGSVPPLQQPELP